MNLNIINYIEKADYSGLKEYLSGKKDHISQFYIHLANYYLENNDYLFGYLKEETFSPEEITIIYDELSNRGQPFKEILADLAKKHEKSLDYDDAFTQEEVIEIANSLVFPKKKKQEYDVKYHLGLVFLLSGAFIFIILCLFLYRLNHEIISFTTILSITIPCLLMVCGANLLFMPKINVILIAVETFILIYILSFICLSGNYSSLNFIAKIRNHFYEVIKALYNLIIYDAMNALEGLEA